MLKKVLFKFKKMIIFNIINGILIAFLSTITIVYFQKLIDSISKSMNINDSINLLLIYALFQLTDYIFSYIIQYPSSSLRNGIYYEFKSIAMKKISTIDYLSYQKYGTGKLVQLIENGACAGRDIINSFYLNIFIYLLPAVVFGIIFIGIYDYKVLIAVALSYIVVFIITKILLKKLYATKTETLINEEKFTSKIVRSFMEMVIFRIGRRYNNEIESLNNTARQITRSKTKILMTHEAFFTIFAVLVIIIKAIAIFIGIRQIYNGNGTIGYIIAIVALIDRIYTPVAIFNVEYVDYKLNKVTLDRYKKLLEEKDDINLTKGIIKKLDCNTIKFIDVNYSYDDIKIIKSLSFDLHKGKSYVLTGVSGAGKTTILSLITGLLKPVDGEISIDNTKLSDINLNNYYSNIEYLSQIPPVFDGTVRENLVFDKKTNDDILFDALDKVNMKEKIMSMENSLDTQIGERGNTLSGGEKQRLAMAKVLINKPKIIILDEPTSALDKENEEQALSSLLSGSHDSIIIAVTHRLSTISIFDEIIKLENGNIR